MRQLLVRCFRKAILESKIATDTTKDDFKLPVIIDKLKNGETPQYTVKFTPTSIGAHTISLLINERHIHDSPFTCQSIEPDNVLVQSDSIAFIGEEKSLIGEFSAQISSTTTSLLQLTPPKLAPARSTVRFSTAQSRFQLVFTLTTITSTLSRSLPRQLGVTRSSCTTVAIQSEVF